MEKNLTHSAYISKGEFIELIKEHNAQQEKLDILSKVGVQLWDSDLIEYGNIMFDRLIKARFTEEGSDWIFWWLYELPSLGCNGPHATDENGDPIPTETIDDLWNLVEKYRK